RAAGGGGRVGRSPLWRNLGDGYFEDALEEAGLGVLGAMQLLEAAFGDVDNDGDLDLLTGRPQLLLLNNGDGTFADATERSGIAVDPGVNQVPIGLALGDWDGDGALDVVCGGRLFRNGGSAHHWLEVEVVGVQSNRCGIGAQVSATAGGRRQMRAVLGGRGYSQDEPMAHFGLGPHAAVDRLEIRWPSGQVDALEGVPADQRIRVTEGRPGYHGVRPTRHRITVPDSVLAGGTARVSAEVRPALFEAGARIQRVTADLSQVGGPGEAPLADRGDGTYVLEPTVVHLGAQTGLRTVSVLVEQATSLGPRWSRATRNVVVVPAADLPICDEGAAPGWSAPELVQGVALEPAERRLVGRGATAVRIDAAGLVDLKIAALEPVELTGYQALHLSFHPGTCARSAGSRLVVFLASSVLEILTNTYDQGALVNLVTQRPLPPGPLDLDAKEWQELEIPLGSFAYGGQSGVELVSFLRFSGSLQGSFYLDDIRLVPAPAPSITAVRDDQADALPAALCLLPNYPNPFNSRTVIPFALPARQRVELVVYSLTGQRVATLAQGEWQAGAHAASWDGRDSGGRQAASGVYLCQLRGGGQAQTRKLLLVR
ncbi:MAG: ASPIC/UnbV domain-containing protein, partial [Candidatus Latescibacterota bacterium]